MIVMGIDPGTALTGYAILKLNKSEQTPTLIEYACIKTPTEMEMPYRLLSLYNELLIVAKAHSPDFMVVERLFFNTNVKTAMSVGQARGIPLLVAAHEKIKVYEYTALEAKLTLTGYGRADKKQLQEAIRVYFGLEKIIKPDDANDAVAIAMCFFNKQVLGTSVNAKISKSKKPKKLTK